MAGQCTHLDPIRDVSPRTPAAAREDTAALRAAFDEQLAIMCEMQETLRALEARLAESAHPTGRRP